MHNVVVLQKITPASTSERTKQKTKENKEQKDNSMYAWKD